MKTKLKGLIFKDFRLVKDSYEKERVISLSNSREFLNALHTYSWKLVSLCMGTKVKTVPRTLLFHRFGLFLLSMYKRNGSLYVVKYLKASQLAIQKVIAGEPFSSLKEIEPDYNLPRLARCGLPHVIRSRDRRALLSGSANVIRMYLTLFGIYRVISTDLQPKLNSITDTFNGNRAFLSASLPWFTRHSEAKLGGPIDPDSITVKKFRLIEKASPSNSSSWRGMITDLVFLSRNTVVNSAILKYLELTYSGYILEYFERMQQESLSQEMPHTLPTKSSMDVFTLNTKYPLWYPIGQLSFKKEAAGKLRIFALVDGWTQTILGPLHEQMFKILKRLPNDGTFDQDASFKRCQEKVSRLGVAYGYDLSAATDRLPMDLQVAIMTSLVGSEIASAWRSILVDRDYCIYENPHVESFQSVRYAVGQPMGALSSWASLAITHHMIMQYASSLCGNTKEWDDRYEVLGDDIIIFDDYLAAKYLELMSHFGVPINATKSVVSIRGRDVIEFAKRTSIRGVDVSPLSWKMFMSQDTFNGRLAIVQYLAGKGILKVNRIFNLVLANTRWDVRPLQDEYSKLALLTSYAKSGRLSIIALLRLISEQGTFRVVKTKSVDFVRLDSAVANRWLELISSGQEVPPSKTRQSLSFSFDAAFVREALIEEIKSLVERMGPDFTEKWVAATVRAVEPEWPLYQTWYTRNQLERALMRDLMVIQVIACERFQSLSIDKLLALAQRLESAFCSITIAGRGDVDRKKVTTSTLAFLKFFKKSLVNRRALAPAVYAFPLRLDAVQSDLLAGTMFAPNLRKGGRD